MAVPPPLPDPALAKPALRAMLREARARFVAALGDAGVAAGEAAIHARLRPLLARAGPLAGFCATRGEPELMPLLDAAARKGVRVALPRIGPDRVMAFAGWQPGAALVRGPLGILQPVATAEVEPAALLVPLLAFDRRGGRLGQGGGHYDRWLAAHPGALRIGIAWSVQEVTRLPIERWDMPLDAVATEREWIVP